jgi:hypothetical protein
VILIGFFDVAGIIRGRSDVSLTTERSGGYDQLTASPRGSAGAAHICLTGRSNDLLPFQEDSEHVG